MASWNLPRFGAIETLQQIRPNRLLAFLRPFRSYLNGHHFPLPSAQNAGQLDCAKLVRIFLSPDSDTPADLIEALYVIDELSTPTGVDKLRAEVTRRAQPWNIQPDLTPADIVLDCWKRDRDLVLQVHTELTFVRVQSYTIYRTEWSPVPTPREPTPGDVRRMVREFDNWFEGRNRGRAVRIQWGRDREQYWFIIRRGDSLKREESWVDGKIKYLCYRPIRYDRVTYTPQTGELAVHAETKGDAEFYCRQFGYQFFNSEGSFPPADLYTLDPLRHDGAAVLDCTTIPGMDWVLLREVKVYQSGEPWAIASLKSNDLFRRLELQKVELPAGRLIEAKFQVKFSSSRSPRMVTILPSNVGRYTRTDDRIIVEQWLQRCGIIRPDPTYDQTHDRTAKPGEDGGERESAVPVLESAR